MNKLTKSTPFFGMLIFGTVILYWMMLGNVSSIVIERWNVYISSKMVFISLSFSLIFFPLILYYFIPKTKLNYYELFLNSALPVLLHYILKLIDYNLPITIFSLLLMLALSAGVYALQKYGGIRRIRMVYYVRHIAAICVMFLVVPAYIHYNYMDTAERYEASFEERRATAQALEKEKETLIQDLQNAKWSVLSADSKTELLNRVVIYESKEFGMKAPRLVIEKFEKKSLKGQYNDGIKTISINSQHLNDSLAACLDTVLHECYHAYQHSVIGIVNQIDKEVYDDNLYFKQAEEWMQARTTYNDDLKTTKSYLENQLEVDARRFALEKRKSVYGFVGQ